MKLAVNYSRPAAALAREGRLAASLFKCHTCDEWVQEAAAVLPVCIHFPLQLGDPAMAGSDWDEVERYRAWTGTTLVNVHLNAERSQFPGMNNGQVIERFRQGMEAVCRRFGPENVIVENVVYRGEDDKWLRVSVEPDTAHSLLDEFGAGLLLDIAHARISAKSLGLDPLAYMEMLPTARLKEMHICGVGTDGPKWRDSMPMSAEDWGLAEAAFSRIRDGRWPAPWMAALEYGGMGEMFELRSDPLEIESACARLRCLMD